MSGSSTHIIISYARLLLFLCPAKFFSQKNNKNKPNGVKKCFNTDVQYQQITLRLTHDKYENKPINSI